MMIKKCPYCKTKPYIIYETGAYYIGCGVVRCDNVKEFYHYKKKDAIKAWNEYCEKIHKEQRAKK